MAVRNCVFTGLPAKSKVKFNKNADAHNWANTVPCNSDYARYRQTLKEPTNEEYDCVHAFWHRELNDLNDYHQGDSINVEEAQKNNLQRMNDWYKIQKEKPARKDKEIEKAYQIKEIIEETEKSIEDYIENRRKLWD